MTSAPGRHDFVRGRNSFHRGRVVRITTAVTVVPFFFLFRSCERDGQIDKYRHIEPVNKRSSHGIPAAGINYDVVRRLLVGGRSWSMVNIGETAATFVEFFEGLLLAQLGTLGVSVITVRKL